MELRAHTAFSFGTAAATPEALVARAAGLGYRSLGITDTADLGAVVRFAVACRAHGVRPVVGVELEVDGRPLALLARDAQGYGHLAALVTRARCGDLARWHREDAGADARAPHRGYPQVRWTDVAERAAGLLLLTGPPSGRLAAFVRRGRRADAARYLARYREAFGAHVAVEVQLHHAGRTEAALAGALVRLAERAGVRWAVAGDARYLDAAGRRALDVLTALRHACTLDEAADQGLLLPNDHWALEAPEAVAARWAGREAGLAETVAIAEACRFDLAWVRPPLPAFPVPAGTTADARLRAVTYAGARERWGEVSDVQVRQLEHELQVIGALGFSGFFLVMHDALAWARRQGILCQGRGSAANSAVTYCLGVTAVDPVHHGLLFERFLSPARVDGFTEAPDIDVDVEHDRREEVLDYVYGRYGRPHAALTCVVQQYSAATAVQDVGRAYGVPLAVVFALSKRMGHLEPAAGAARLRGGAAPEAGTHVAVRGASAADPGLAEAHGLTACGLGPETPRGAAFLDAVAAFEGLPRLRSTHPGGMVLSAAPLGDYAPVEPTTMGRTVLQFDKDDLDTAGIPKFDFLGLGALSMIRRAFDTIAQRTGERPELYRLPPDDRRTFRMIARGDTVGTFQIESRAQIASLVHTRPEKLYDLVVQVALIRPGPIQAKFVHPYVERRRGREPVVYPPGLEAALAPVLGRTMAVPIFQEQAMALSMALGGYSAAEADELRRTMGNQRKLPRLEAALERLRVRMVAQGVADDVAAQLAGDLRAFSNYGFPESHAWSFALLAYATAYLKAHHPTEFYAGLLNAQPMGFYPVEMLVDDAAHHGVEVRLPCLTFGDRDCTAEERDEDPARPALRLGWRFVRGLGDAALARLAAARAAGPFRGVADVVRRAGLARAEATALAAAHAFAVWEAEPRRAAWAALRGVGDVLPLAPAAPPPAAPSLADEASADEASAADGFAPRARGRHEEILADYAALGLSTAGHPMERWRAWCRRQGVLDSAQFRQCRGGERVIVAGLVRIRQRPQSAKGTVFLLLTDEHGVLNVIVWKTLDAQQPELVRHAPVLAVYGTVTRDGPEVSLVARRFRALGEAEAAARDEGGPPVGTAAPRTPLAVRSRDFR